LTNLLKPTQRLFLRPEIASFLVKISSTSKTCNMSDRSELGPDYSYNRSPNLNHFNILFLEDDIFEMNKLQISNGYLNSVRFSLN